MVNKVFFPKLSLWLFLLLPLLVIAFYPSYWSRIGENIDTVTHVHAFFLTLWVVMCIVQPYLIIRKKAALHKQLGRFSYILMPLLLVSGYLLLLHRYDRNSQMIRTAIAEGKMKAGLDQVAGITASSVAMGLVLFLLLATFYILAVINRKSILHHATYMIAAIFVVLEPVVDRVLLNLVLALKMKPSMMFAFITPLLIISLLTAIAIYQKRRGMSLKPVLISIVFYVIAFAVVFVGSRTAAWQWFAELILFR